MIKIIISALSVGGLLFGIIYWACKSANNSNIPSVDDRKPISKMSKRELKRRGYR